MSQFSLNDWCSEIESFKADFNEFALFSKKNIPDNHSFVKTQSLKAFIERFDYFTVLTKDEEDEFLSDFECVRDLKEEHKEYMKLAEYIEDLAAYLDLKFGCLRREGRYDLIHKWKLDNYLTLSREQRKSYEFPHIDHWLDEMVDFLYSSIKDYFWVKHKVKCQAVEEIIKILQAGGMPCGYKVTKPHEDILQQEVEFLVFWPHKDNA